jgi:hypothetical protein
MVDVFEKIRVFDCPACGATMNTSYSNCPSCHVPVDHAAAEAAATALSIVNQACSDASFISITFYIILGIIPTGLGLLAKFHISGALLMFSAVGLNGILSMLYLVALLTAVLLFSVVVMAASWWRSFGSKKIADRDFVAARKSVRTMTTFALAIIVLVAGFSVALWLRMP